MKKLLIFILLFIPAVLLSAADINTAKDLEAFIKAYNASEDLSVWMSSDSTFRFGADIDLSKAKKLPQIQAFAGVLDGAGHKITGWKTQNGLIKEVLPEAVVKNIIIDKTCSMKTVSKTELFTAGFIADLNNGTISGCVNYGSISHKCTYTQNHIFIGGIVGVNKFCVLDCCNYGRIFSESTGADANDAKEITCSVGGIVGGANGKVKAGSTVVRCVNYGEVSQYCDFISAAVGGVVGLSGASTVKFCVNRGIVTSEMAVNSNANKPGVAKVGGIVGLAKGDVMCNDNFGQVVGKGVGTSYVGGIVGMPHAALVVGDCVNFGNVSASAEGQNFVGGIGGNCGRPVHFRRCFNKGAVTFDGVCPRSRSAAGGILGQSYLTRKFDTATYIRECGNYGCVRSESGGNNYGNSDAAIHTGGICGYMESREGVLSYLYDCANEGKVTSATGRRSNMCACTNNVITGGVLTDNQALSVEPRGDGANVYGRVLTTEGAPVEGVVVTDGLQCVKTAADGSYSMTSNLNDTYFIYISVPAAYKAPTVASIPQTFRRVARGEKAVCANFTLEARASVENKYTLLMVGDPQVRPLKYGDNSMETWTTDVAPDIEAYRASCTGDVYAINLGDLVYNFMSAYDDYLDGAAKINCPVFNVIGNHDYDQQTLFDGHLGQVFYETYVGPENYSFDLGDIHYIIVNSIMYDRAKPSAKYGSGLDDKTVEWLANDLSYVSRDKTLVVCGHANLFKKPGTSPNGSHGAYNRNYKRYLALLKDFAHVYSWSGHYHQNYYYNYEGKNSKHGAPNIESITVARCTGALRFNKPIAADGTPQGYMVAEVDGSRMTWAYKAVGRDIDYQIKAYAPGRCNDAMVRATIWNYSEGWSTPEWWENGRKVGEMQLVKGTDPDYKDLWDAFTNKRDRKYCVPDENCWIFGIEPSEGVTCGEIRVKDQFGKEYISTIKW
ncbi:MAG: calcineurin-like phosphoesterase family protein [Bacteroidales bacterium]|nr:calcineurin-like phosphoesterase family protein [Bacteroidales bacterium]